MNQPSQTPRVGPLGIVLIYVLLSGLWITFSDSALGMLYPDPAELTSMQTVKGWFYVFVSGSLLYWLIARYAQALQTAERARAAAARKVSEQRAILESAVDSMGDGVVVVDTSGRCLRVNPFAEAIVDRRESAAPLEAWPQRYGFYLPDMRTPCPPEEFPLARAIRGERVSRAEVYQLRPGSSEGRWFSVTARPLAQNGKNLRGAVAVFRDITGQKDAEAAFFEGQRVMTTLLGNLPGMAYRCKNDPDFPMEFVSDGCQTLTGYTSTELTQGSLSYASLIVPEDRQHVWDTVQAAVKTRTPFTITYRIKRADGAIRWVWEQGCGIFAGDGSVLALEGFISDVTGMKEAEAGMARLAMAVEQAVEAILITDPEGVIEYVNPAFERITGYSRNEALGNKPSMLKSGVHDEAFYRELWSTLLAGEVWHGRLINKRKDGATYTEEGTISPVRDETGKTTHYVAVKRDVTRETRLEAQMLQSQKLEAIGTLAGGIAHDFNNILTAIMGYAELAVFELPEDDKVRKDVLEILRAGERAKDLIRQILTFSRQTTQDRQLLPPDVIVNEAVKLLRATLPATIELRLQLDPDIGHVFADPSQLHQVVMNLCTNAYHAMQRQGGVLFVELQNFELDADHAKTFVELGPGAYVRLTVSDTGHGMDTETMKRIFEPFYTTKAEQEGTGLGLSTVHGIVTSCGGAITVYSEVGRGTVFHVYLPREEVESSAIAVQSSATAPQGQGERVLFVDDEEALARLGRIMLERLNYQVTAYTNSAEALDAFRAAPHRFDLVVTDQTMAGLTGLDLARAVREARSDLPIIIMTGFSELVPADKAAEAGVAMVLTKPLLSRDLGTAVQQALGRRPDAAPQSG